MKENRTRQSIVYGVKVKRPKIDNGEANLGCAFTVHDISTQHTVATKFTTTASTLYFTVCSSVRIDSLKDLNCHMLTADVLR